MSNNLRNKLIQLKTKQQILQKQKDSYGKKLTKEKTANESLIKARWVITEVSKQTQELFKERVETLTTMAIRSVFNRPFNFKLNFERRANKIECTPIIEENGEEYIPKDEMGGGILPIISFALRVVMWSLEVPKSRKVLVLDEPIKGAVGNDGGLLEKTAMMFKEISAKLGLQLIIVTHELTLAGIADRAWRVTHDGVKSNIKQIGDK